jgi:hypothetical protein
MVKWSVKSPTAVTDPPGPAFIAVKNSVADGGGAPDRHNG